MIIIKDISHWLLCIHRLYKENGGPCLSIWRIWKYDPGRFYAEQSLHCGYHEQHQELLHQSNKTKIFNKIMNHIAAIYIIWFIHDSFIIRYIIIVSCILFFSLLRSNLQQSLEKCLISTTTRAGKPRSSCWRSPSWSSSPTHTARSTTPCGWTHLCHLHQHLHSGRLAVTFDKSCTITVVVVSRLTITVVIVSRLVHL